jgi:hypothetical protein
MIGSGFVVTSALILIIARFKLSLEASFDTLRTSLSLASLNMPFTTLPKA